MKLTEMTLAALLVVGIATPLSANTGPQLFKTSEDAVKSCAGDDVVWIILNGRHYYKQADARFGKGEGLYSCEKEAHSRYTEAKGEG